MRRASHKPNLHIFFSSVTNTRFDIIQDYFFPVHILHIAKKALYACAVRKLKKAIARSSKARTGGMQQPGSASVPKQEETSTGTPKKVRSEGSTPTETATSPKIPRDSSKPGAYKEALTIIKIAIFKETYPEDTLTEGD
jgi:hypothetical protein